MSKVFYLKVIIKKSILAGVGVAQFRPSSVDQQAVGWCSVRAHTQVGGLIPGQARMRRHTSNVFLSLSPSLSLSKINEESHDEDKKIHSKSICLKEIILWKNYSSLLIFLVFSCFNK